jgi:hypothetical protein
MAMHAVGPARHRGDKGDDQIRRYMEEIEIEMQLCNRAISEMTTALKHIQMYHGVRVPIKKPH